MCPNVCGSVRLGVGGMLVVVDVDVLTMRKVGLWLMC
jgi:hypothetical protein